MARSFNGTTQQLTRATAPLSAYGGTMAAWLRTSSFAAQRWLFQFGSTGDANSRGGLDFATSGALQAVVRNGTTLRQYTTTATASADTWAHAAATFTSSSNILAYLNGSSTGSVTSSSTPTWPAYNNVTFGALRRTTYTYGLGDVAEAAVWSTVLSQNEIDMLAAGYSPLMVSPQSLTNYWPLFGRAGAAGDEDDWVGSILPAQTNSPTVIDHPRIIYPRRRIWTPPSAAAAGLPTLSALSAINITSTAAQPRITYTF